MPSKTKKNKLNNQGYPTETTENHWKPPETTGNHQNHWKPPERASEREPAIVQIYTTSIEEFIGITLIFYALEENSF